MGPPTLGTHRGAVHLPTPLRVVARAGACKEKALINTGMSVKANLAEVGQPAVTHGPALALRLLLSQLRTGLRPAAGNCVACTRNTAFALMS